MVQMQSNLIRHWNGNWWSNDSARESPGQTGTNILCSVLHSKSQENLALARNGVTIKWYCSAKSSNLDRLPNLALNTLLILCWRDLIGLMKRSILFSWKILIKKSMLTFEAVQVGMKSGKNEDKGQVMVGRGWFGWWTGLHPQFSAISYSFVTLSICDQILRT